MTVYGCNNYNYVNTCRMSDPAGLGVPFSPFYSPCAPDSFECHGKPNERREEGFTADKAAGSFVKGMAEPFVEMLKHPIKTLGIAAGIGYAAKRVPKVGRLAAIAGAIIGGVQLLGGLGKAITGMVDKKDEVAEEGFKSMGTGTVSTLLSALGIKSANKKIAALEKTGSSGTPEASTNLLTKVKGFFGGKKDSASTVKVCDVAKEIPEAVINGTKYVVPFAPYLSTVSEGTSEGGKKGERQPLSLRMADEVSDKFNLSKE